MRHLPPRRLASGASMVEFVVVFPLAVLFVLSVIQAGLVYMAKLTLNHATFMAARVGSLNNASDDAIREALLRGLSPFYQDGSQADDKLRLGDAYLAAKADNLGALPWHVRIDKLSPSPDTFADFGVRDPFTKVIYIPNAHLEWRPTNQLGARSKVNIRDANLLKIRVVYGYQLKVPLMAGILGRVMCSGSIGVDAFGDVSLLESVYSPANANCLRYYLLGRMPIESTAIVEMQSPAHQ